MSTGLHGMAIASIAAYAPPNRVSNDQIATRLHTEKERTEERLGRTLSADEAKAFETSDRWIRRFIGFSERRFTAAGEGTHELALRAAQLLLQQRGFDPSEIDDIVFATVTPSYLHSPPDAALLQHALGVPEILHGQPHELGGICASLACSSWVAGLRFSYGLIRSGMAKKVLLIGADAMSTAISWRDRAFATVLGDAGTAMELIAVPEADDEFSPSGFWCWLGGSHAETIITPQGGSRNPLRDARDLCTYRNCLTMDGRTVKDVIVPFVGGPAADAALRKAGLTLADLDVAVLHEANLVLNADIIKAWRSRGFRGTVLDAGGMFGNTTSASIPLALALHADALKVGTRFGLIGFGGGFSAVFAFGTIRNPISVITNL